MIVLSLYQPYATLVILGLKRIETRSFLTHHRGQIGIHATQASPRYARDLAQSLAVQSAMRPFNEELKELWGEPFPNGSLLGTVDMMDCLSTNQSAFTPKHGFVPPNGDTLEHLVGDYSANRWMWLLENPQMYPELMPVRGWQRLWHFRGGEGEKS